MMVVKLMIILTIATATSRDWRLEGGLSDSCLLPGLVLVSHISEDRFYFCTDGLLLCWVRNAPPRPPRLAAPSDILWMLS